MLPKNFVVMGYARSALTVAELCERLRQYLPKDKSEKIEEFFKHVKYCAGPYDDVKGFHHLNQELQKHEAELSAKVANRMFYLALPPTTFVAACTGIKNAAMSVSGWNRVVVEKPFGRDTDSSKILATDIGNLFSESEIYRIDHYLGKEMVQNLVTLRFANHIFSVLWSHEHIKNVQITFKEQIGTQGRGGYFDNFGIIRDVIQNHIFQILALVSMEKPKSLSGEHIRDEKVQVLRCVKPVTTENCVLGQYTAPADGSEGGYLEDPTVPKGSKCPTFASMVLFIDNDRWQNVPFIIKAGKALNSKEVTIRIQFREEILPFGGNGMRNELVIRAQPNEAMFMKIVSKAPGMSQNLRMTELDLTYKSRYGEVRLPDAYESLIYEVMQGNTTNFVRSDELDAAWRIVTPLLHSIDKGAVQPIPYQMGSRGPKEADELSTKHGYKRSEQYTWSSPKM